MNQMTVLFLILVNKYKADLMKKYEKQTLF